MPIAKEFQSLYEQQNELLEALAKRHAEGDPRNKKKKKKKIGDSGDQNEKGTVYRSQRRICLDPFAETPERFKPKGARLPPWRR